MKMKASQLVELLNKHIEKHGDGDVMIYDDYAVVYKTLSRRHVSCSVNKNFTIECEQEDRD